MIFIANLVLVLYTVLQFIPGLERSSEKFFFNPEGLDWP